MYTKRSFVDLCIQTYQASDQRAQELSGSPATANTLMGGIDEVFQRTDATGVHGFLTDALGSSLALTDSTGALETTLTLILLSLCRYPRGLNGVVVVNKGERESFLVEHYTAVNWLFVTYGRDEKDNDGLTTQVSDYFEKISRPPTIH